MNISPIMLGTAQLTNSYGIANTSSGFSKESAFLLLENAIKHGITTWDTSPVYGNSEEVIGQYLKKNNSSVTISTKMPSIVKKYGYNIKSRKLNNIISRNIDVSLEMLNREIIDYYFIHDEQDYITYGNDLINSLYNNINAGKIATIGISVYKPKTADLAFKEKKINLIQLPFNIFDQRFRKHINKAQDYNVGVIIRSVFLQGLLFLSLDMCKNKVPLAYIPLQKLIQITKDYNLSIAEIAVGYIRSIDGISSMVLGMENLQQLNENAALMNMSNLSDELIHELDNIFKDIPIEIIDPTNWKN